MQEYRLRRTHRLNRFYFPAYNLQREYQACIVAMSVQGTGLILIPQDPTARFYRHRRMTLDPKSPSTMRHQPRKFSLEPQNSALHASYSALSFADVVSQINLVQRRTAGPREPVLYYPAPERTSNFNEGCFDQSTLFRSMDTLAFCVALATAAVLYQGDPPILNLNRTGGTAAMWAGFYIADLANFDGARLLQSLVSCAIGSCQNSSVANCSQSTLALGHVEFGPRTLSDVYNGLVNYCDDIAIDPNADIAGPGVRLPPSSAHSSRPRGTED